MLSAAEKVELERSIEEIWELALEMGYDPYPINFEVAPVHVIYELGAYSLPARFSHWTFGRDYHRQKTSYEYGMSKIYEIVFNTDPCQAFLMDSNSMTSHKLTIAHVIGHCHFFKHNDYFAQTDRQMIEKVGLHRDRIAQYEQEFGWREVEAFLDAVMCVEEHFDPTSHLIKSGAIRTADGTLPTGPDSRNGAYDDLWNVLGDAPKPKPMARKFPEEPEKDLLLFLANYGRDLMPWQRDILAMVREEMLYFLPQMRTKIMNEGFASLAHERILERYLHKSEEIWEFRKLHSGVLSPSPVPGQINPYYVGFQILKDIERRWNGEREGDETEADWLGREKVRPTGEGWRKVFEVCAEESDASFLRKYLTESLVKRLDLYTYKREESEGEDRWVVQTTDWEKVRDTMIDGMTNFGVPIIRVEDGDYGRRGELYLKHAYDGKPIDVDYGEKVLHAIYHLWGRPVHLETVLDDVPTRLSYDGETDKREAA